VSAAYRLGELAERFGLELRGDAAHCVDGVATLAAAGPTQLAFLANSAYRAQMRGTLAGAVVLREADAAECPGAALVARDPYVAYAKIAEHASRAAKPGGLVVFSSCSSAVDLSALTRALATGAQRVGRQAVILHRSFQGPDHPVPAAHPEGLYLKSVVARLEPR